LSEEHHYDLIVVGGGPAGSSAAFAAAKQGIKVAMLEKESSIAEELAESHGFKISKNLEFQRTVIIQ
jgi:digeranylgeranylglycerophospholipid reductase